MAVTSPAVLSGTLLAPSRSASAAALAAARSLREARRGPSGGRGASSPSRRRRRRRPGSQHGGGGGGGRGPGDGPRAGVRRGAALHQPLVHRRGRLRHGVVSVRARPQARPRPPIPPHPTARGRGGRSRGLVRAPASRAAATPALGFTVVGAPGAGRGLGVARGVSRAGLCLPPGGA